MNKILCNIYRSSRKEGMYLYVTKNEDLGRVPETLLELFGRPALVTTMLIDKEKKLAHVDAANLLINIISKGFYLQMPPQQDAEMRKIAEQNSKLEH